MNRIHATALVDPSAQIADDVEIGAFSIVGPKVTIGPGSRIGPHVVLTGRTTLGLNTRIPAYSSLRPLAKSPRTKNMLAKIPS
jgi:UDP-N-acetylglucosamine acyltransferase